jgi:hypothetical protein
MHEGLCSKSDFTRLLAIALLNWADDEGYFMANPVLIRGQVFPFLDDSKIIPRSLLELSSVGWIELGKDDEGRDVGKIINFAKHQRVDKPKRSTIKDKARFQDASKNNLGLFQEASKEEGKGREEEGMSSCPASAAPPPDEMPIDSHGNAEAEAAVDWFLALLNETGARAPKLTPSARHGWADAFDKLTRIDGHSLDRVKAVCRWARNDSFWRANFMAPPKLREKKHGVSYIDQFLNKMGQTPAGTPVTPLPSIPAPHNFREFMAENYPKFNAYPVGQNNANCQWKKLPRTIQEMVADDMRKAGAK